MHLGEQQKMTQIFRIPNSGENDKLPDFLASASSGHRHFGHLASGSAEQHLSPHSLSSALPKPIFQLKIGL